MSMSSYKFILTIEHPGESAPVIDLMTRIGKALDSTSLRHKISYKHPKTKSSLTLETTDKGWHKWDSEPDVPA